MMASNEQEDPFNRQPEPKFLGHQGLEVKPPVIETQEQPEESTPKPTASNLANNASMSNSSSRRSSQEAPVLTPDGTPEADNAHTRALYDANIRVQTLEQQIFVAERHIIQLHEHAGQREHGLIEHIQGLTQANATLDGNINYLINELEKANAVNQGLNRELQHLKRRTLSNLAPPPPSQRGTAAQRQLAPSQQQQVSAASSAHPIPPAPRAQPPALTLQTQNLPPAPTSPLDDPTTMLIHAQTSLRSLRAEVRSLKTSKLALQDRLVHLANATQPDDVAADFLRGFGLPPHVVEKWFEVLRARDRKIAGLEALVEREREMR